MEKTKLEQPVPFEDIYFRRSEGGPSVLIIEKPVPMSDANYRHGHKTTDPEQVRSFIQLTERYSTPEVEVECEETIGFKTIEGVEAESVGESLNFTTSVDFLEITGNNYNKTIDFIPLVKDEDDMASDLATYLATQQSIKAYADAIASHLGFDDLSDPDADRILFWDDSETALKWLALADELSISATTLSVDHDLCTNFASTEHFTVEDENNILAGEVFS